MNRETASLPRLRRPLARRISLFIALTIVAALAVMVLGGGAVMHTWMTFQTDKDLRDRLVRISQQEDLLDIEGTGETLDIGPLVPSSDPAAPPSDPDDDGPGHLRGPGLNEGYLQLVAQGDEVSAGVIRDFAVIDLESSAEEQLLRVPPNGRGHSMSLDGVGRVRVVAADIDGTRIVVGSTLDTTNRITIALMWMEGVLALVIAGIGAFVGLRWVRREMRPLARVAAAARSVGSLDLQSNSIGKFERVDAATAQDGTEVGDVGRAFNTMIDNVESALRARVLSEEQLRQFVADASHELRTPLASIQGYAQLMRKDAVSPDHALERITSESARMTDLVEDLLLLARLDAGRDLTMGPVDLVPLVIDALADAHAASTDHEWSLDIAEGTPECVVNADEGAVRQVLANLIGNARVHTPPGTHVTVGVHTVTARRQAAPSVVALPPADSAEDAPAAHGWVVLEVCDNGPGIPAELRSQVFHRFVRSDTSRSRSTGSTGLGLAIVASIVGEMGGAIELDSSPAGTTFRVILPHLPDGD